MLEKVPVLSLEAARRMMAAAEAEASRNRWSVAIAIVDSAGRLLLFQRMDHAHLGAIDISIGKARTAANFDRPTKALEEMIANGRTAFLAVDGLVPVQGGVPVTVEGHLVGAVGVSGVSSAEDEQIAMAAAAALAAG